MRWVQVTPGVTLKNYTFSKLLDLSKSNGQKKILINANILIKISFIIPYLCHFILISKPKKIYMFLSLSSNTLPPPWPRQYHVFFCPKIVRSNILRVHPIYPHTEFFFPIFEARQVVKRSEQKQKFINIHRIKQLKKLDRKSTRLNSSHLPTSRMPSSA